ncbi:hypothetical protein [Streptomyces sp. NPDC058394]|uniref:hypothetical protein n=1 Tax=Streptomyces sp. NPDC058394 TaxID=3346477 RepID=UPI003660C8F5
MAAGGGNGGGLFSAAWGLWATGFGWIIATDFRGAARRFHGMSQKFTLFDRATTSVNGVGFVRCVAGVFALAGPPSWFSGLWNSEIPPRCGSG